MNPEYLFNTLFRQVISVSVDVIYIHRFVILPCLRVQNVINGFDFHLRAVERAVSFVHS
jgi:hypothetical protein